MVISSHGELIISTCILSRLPVSSSHSQVIIRLTRHWSTDHTHTPIYHHWAHNKAVSCRRDSAHKQCSTRTT